MLTGISCISSLHIQWTKRNDNQILYQLLFVLHHFPKDSVIFLCEQNTGEMHEKKEEQNDHSGEHASHWKLVFMLYHVHFSFFHQSFSWENATSISLVCQDSFFKLVACLQEWECTLFVLLWFQEVVWASLLLIATAGVAFYSAMLVSRCMKVNPTIMTYHDIGQRGFGHKERLLVSTYMLMETSNLPLYRTQGKSWCWNQLSCISWWTC